MAGTRALTQDDLDNALLGACILGAGGGGPLSIGKDLRDYLLKVGKPIFLIEPADAPAGAQMAVSAVIGSPDAAAGGPFPYEVPVIAYQALDAIQQQRTGQSFGAVLAAELGAGNSMIPLIVAQALGIPMVDADGARRAVPAIQMASYAANVALAPPCPVVLANSSQTVSFSAPSPEMVDATTRGIISSGSWTEDAGIALWAMSGAVMNQLAVPNTLSYAIGLGAALKAASNPVSAVCEYIGGHVLFTGTMSSSSSSTQGGFDFGTVTLKAANGDLMRIYNQNENLIAWTSASPTPVAMAPDLICYLTTDGQPFSNADLKLAEGKEIAVIGTPCVPELRQPVILDAFQAALQKLGYGGPYVPLEQLQAYYA